MDYSSCSSELDESNKSYRSQNSILGSSDKSFENRPYQCPICDEEFFEGNALTEHTTIVHDGVLQDHNSDISDSRLAAGQPRPTVTTEVFFFFSPQLVCNRTKVLGHTGGSFFFNPIGSRPYKNFGRYSKVFLFHPNWFATLPKFWEL